MGKKRKGQKKEEAPGSAVAVETKPQQEQKRSQEQPQRKDDRPGPSSQPQAGVGQQSRLPPPQEGTSTGPRRELPTEGQQQERRQEQRGWGRGRPDSGAQQQMRQQPGQQPQQQQYSQSQQQHQQRQQYQQQQQPQWQQQQQQQPQGQYQQQQRQQQPQQQQRQQQQPQQQRQQQQPQEQQRQQQQPQQQQWQQQQPQQQQRQQQPPQQQQRQQQPPQQQQRQQQPQWQQQQQPQRQQQQSQWPQQQQQHQPQQQQQRQQQQQQQRQQQQQQQPPQGQQRQQQHQAQAQQEQRGWGRGRPDSGAQQQMRQQPAQQPRQSSSGPTGEQGKRPAWGQRQKDTAPPQETSRRQGQAGERGDQTVSLPSSSSASSYEDDKQIQQLLSHLSITERRLGTECRSKTTLIVNYFPLNTAKLKNAYHYDVAIEPDKPKKALPRIMEELRKKRYPQKNPAYDGSKNLYSSTPLVDSGEISDKIKIKLDTDEKEYTVTIKLVSELDLTCLHDSVKYARDTSILDMTNPSTPLQCLNVILTNVPALSYERIGRSYFTPPPRQYKLGDGCILYHGFSQAAILRWKPFVNVDVAHKAFTERVYMIDLIKEMCPNAIEKGVAIWELNSLRTYLKRMKVSYELPNMKKVYVINDLDESPKRATFKPENGREMTVEQYFRNNKNLPLRYPHLPTLWVGNTSRRPKILLPLEFCTIVPGQPVNKNMTEKQVRNMIKEVSQNTKVRLDKIQQSVNNLNYNNHPVMREFGLTVSTTPQEVEARILKAPILQYQETTKSVNKGVWQGGKFLEGAKLDSWTIVSLDFRTPDEILRELGKQLMNTAYQSGVSVGPPQPAFHRLRDASELRDYFSKNSYRLVIIILNNKEDCYSQVKRASELMVGCLTQCIKSKTISRGIQRATVSNILLKINAKLNGRNHSIPTLPLLREKPAIIMGADVTHPGSSNFPSIAAVTASYDVNFFKYRFEWRLQPPRKEMIEDLKTITMEHLRFFNRSNNAKPEKIVYIRDGVSDGQFMEVLKVELNAIRGACMQLSPDYKPAIIFIVVQKRHRTRFFPKDLSICEDPNMNVPAGTCVDSVITHPSLTDFFLVSHASIKGVARPTKYVKLWDDCDMSEDDVEKLMYYLCHMYARCNRSVSYPAPTYYAHHAAARAKAYCDKNIDTSQLEREQGKLQIRENIKLNTPMFFV